MSLQLFRAGSVAYSTVGDAFLLWSGKSSASPTLSGFWKAGITAAPSSANAYSVTALKSLYIVKILTSYGGPMMPQIGYGDAGVNPNHTGANPAGSTSVWGDAITGLAGFAVLHTTSSVNTHEADLDDIIAGPIPAGKFPYMRDQSNTTGTFNMWCIEV